MFNNNPTWRTPGTFYKLANITAHKKIPSCGWLTEKLFIPCAVRAFFFLSCLPSSYVLQVEIHQLIKISFLHRTSALNLESLSNALVCKLDIFLPKVSAPSSHSSACSLRLGRGKLTSRQPSCLSRSSHRGDTGHREAQKVGGIIAWALIAPGGKGALTLLMGFMAGRLGSISSGTDGEPTKAIG